MIQRAAERLWMDGRVLIVTGGGSGIGRATAMLLASRGADVVIADIDEVAGLETATQIGRLGGNAAFVRTDIAREADVSAMVDFAVATFGRLDGAFNNAGIVPGHNTILGTSLAEWQRCMDVNLTGMFLCMKYEIAHMVRHGGGAIVNTSSSAGTVGFPDAVSYVSSKHGTVGLTRAAALDHAAENIRVNAVLPGGIETPMMHAAMANSEFRDTAARSIPMGRIGQPEELAETAAWLLSDAASYVTGACIMADGGITAM